MQQDPKPLSDWLQNPSTTAGGLLARLQSVETVDRALRDWLNTPEPNLWASSVRVAAIEGGNITVYCADATALTRFRYRSGEALTFLRQRFGESCARIEARVRPTISP